MLRWHNRIEADGLLPEDALSIVPTDAVNSIHPDTAFTTLMRMLVPRGIRSTSFWADG